MWFNVWINRVRIGLSRAVNCELLPLWTCPGYPPWWSPIHLFSSHCGRRCDLFSFLGTTRPSSHLPARLYRPCAVIGRSRLVVGRPSRWRWRATCRWYISSFRRGPFRRDLPCCSWPSCGRRALAGSDWILFRNLLIATFFFRCLSLAQ